MRSNAQKRPHLKPPTWVPARKLRFCQQQLKLCGGGGLQRRRLTLKEPFASCWAAAWSPCAAAGAGDTPPCPQSSRPCQVVIRCETTPYGQTVCSLGRCSYATQTRQPVEVCACNRCGCAAPSGLVMEEAFRALLAAGADPCAAAGSGDTPLHAAAAAAHAPLAALLLSTRVRSAPSAALHLGTLSVC